MGVGILHRTIVVTGLRFVGNEAPERNILALTLLLELLLELLLRGSLWWVHGQHGGGCADKLEGGSYYVCCGADM